MVFYLMDNERIAIDHALREQLGGFYHPYEYKCESSVPSRTELSPQERDTIVYALRREYNKIKRAHGDQYGSLPLEWLQNLITYLKNPQEYPDSFIPCPKCGRRINSRLPECEECELEQKREEAANN